MPLTHEQEPASSVKVNGTIATVTKALISAPTGTNASALCDLLRQRGLVPFFADDVSLPGQTVAEALREGVGQADLVVAILDEQRDCRSVYLELGVALGLNKRVLLLASAAEVLPGATLSGVPMVQATAAEVDKIAWALDVVLAAPPRRARAGAFPGRRARLARSPTNSCRNFSARALRKRPARSWRKPSR